MEIQERVENSLKSLLEQLKGKHSDCGLPYFIWLFDRNSFFLVEICKSCKQQLENNHTFGILKDLLLSLKSVDYKSSGQPAIKQYTSGYGLSPIPNRISPEGRKCFYLPGKYHFWSLYS